MPKRFGRSAFYLPLFLYGLPAFAEVRLPTEAEWGGLLMEEVSTGTVSCSSCAIDSSSVSHLKIQALVGLRGPLFGHRTVFGIFGETGFGRQSGEIAALGNRSSWLDGSRYGLGMLFRRWKFYGFGALIFHGNFNMTAVTADPQIGGVTPSHLSFNSPFGFKLGGGFQLSSALHLHGNFSQVNYGSYSYSDPVTKQGVTVDLGSSPMTETTYGVGLSVVF